IVLRSIRPDEFFPQVTLTIRKSDYLISRLEVIDSNETRITINLRNVQLNPPVSTQDFTFEPPESSDVVDLRS
ncbi:MAG: outer-membrane lipoprotein carrier protein LolA, partial [Rhodothermales bacterium]|nr:outer-membrane lipoprotein carrier protein LolA [Rhodothermales bacterium]